jgi:ATP-dependent DNA helicase RecG
MSAEALRARIAAGEDESTIFVSGVDNLEKLGRAVCALLNTHGGMIVCGVRDGAPVGLAKINDDTIAEVENHLRQAISPLALFMVNSVDLDEHRLVVIEVPQAKDRPYVVDGGVWLRAGGQVVAADIATLRQMLRGHADTPLRWERRISTTMTYEDLDIGEVRATVRDALKSKRSTFGDDDDELILLSQLAAYQPSGFTHGGDVLFSRNPGLRHPQARVQLVVFSGDKTSDDFTDNRWLEGPLVRVCRELLAAVGALNAVKSSFEETGNRRDRPSYDARALREGIVNAFVHRDYAAYSGGLRVSVYPSRIEIWNSGRLPETLTPGAMQRGAYESIPTNPDIAHVFYLRGMMERIGRGTELIMGTSKLLGAPSPVWRDASTGVTLIIYSANAAPELAEPLNRRQEQLLADLAPGQTMTLKTFHERYAADVSERQARRDLVELVRRSVLRQEGRGPSTIYRLAQS